MTDKPKEEVNLQEIIQWIIKQPEYTSMPTINSNSLFYYTSPATYAMFIKRYFSQLKVSEVEDKEVSAEEKAQKVIDFINEYNAADYDKSVGWPQFQTNHFEWLQKLYDKYFGEAYTNKVQVDTKIKVDFSEGIIAEDTEGFIGVVEQLKIVVTGKTKQECLEEILVSIKVLLAYNSGIDISKNKVQVSDAVAFLNWVDGKSYVCDLHTDDGEKIWWRYGKEHTKEKGKTTEELYKQFKDKQ